MARFAFLLLCHRDPVGVIAQVRALTAAGDVVAIHFDARGAAADYAQIEAAFRGDGSVTLARRVRCGWGEWSLVQATLNAAEAALAAFPDATHLYMVSGDCRPIKSAVQARAILAERDVDRIETVDFFTSGWIRTGLAEERLIYRHWFNERRRKRLFYWSLAVQQRLRLRRAIPEGLGMRIGSQWWCLRRATVEAVLALCRARPDVVRFFRTTWIPDETFFQTLVAHLVPRAQIDPRPPTFVTFTDYGMPTTFHDDHHDFLVGQPELFARKISPEATRLRARLDALWASDAARPPSGADGRAVVSFVTSRGRVGRRFGRRAWEAAAEMGPERCVVALISRDRARTRALAEAIRAEGLMPAFGYIFHEEADALPDLGGVETSLAKRTRHRRAVLHLLFEASRAARLAVCMEPADLGPLRDILAGKGALRVLSLETVPSDALLRRIALAEGLLGAGSTEEEAAQVLPVLAGRLAEEDRRLREADLPVNVPVAPDAAEAETCAALQAVLGCDKETARALAAADAGRP
ncbi:DUF5928 domain-containing protein [Jannaschia seohaensis]|uniref:Peptide O-xylosyltransferase n=1 Tax=Jannaschia seohaensis TaxID=475081 RepID=A0A2Y9A422_9RHOB|nr:DUF5928 domain-containing protein [Jannaschia seohaensis]PWJ22348.1 core-2/I-Branching enzyme [Jannaschia seohaensis]SSA38626.1 Core-2/I-Branching enzyme [Jannaschia seohaensis]